MGRTFLKSRFNKGKDWKKTINYRKKNFKSYKKELLETNDKVFSILS